MGGDNEEYCAAKTHEDAGWAPSNPMTKEGKQYGANESSKGNVDEECRCGSGRDVEEQGEDGRSPKVIPYTAVVAPSHASTVNQKLL